MQLINPYFQLFESLSTQPEAFQLELRKRLIWAYSWAVPSNEVILKIAHLSPLLEIGAGTGYWSWLLKQSGADVIATDRGIQPPSWCEIHQAEAEAARKYPERTLLLCWPPYQEEMATVALTNYSGRKLVYIGEWGGRTADEKFHSILASDWILDEPLEIPRWPGYLDSAYFLIRK